ENKKYLVLREIYGGGVIKLLANKESLASCDIAVFVHDRPSRNRCGTSQQRPQILG
ncbi:mitochondrial rho GTPase 1-like protein, partial [Trifolium pratense]